MHRILFLIALLLLSAGFLAVPGHATQRGGTSSITGHDATPLAATPNQGGGDLPGVGLSDLANITPPRNGRRSGKSKRP
jgi:hypothetical protein